MALVKQRLFDEEDGGTMTMITSFGYIDSRASFGLTAQPGADPCMPIPKKWAVVEPLMNRVKAATLEDAQELIGMLSEPFFTSPFKLFCTGVSSPYFFGGVEQEEREFSRAIEKGSTVLHLLEAMYDIFVDAKIHPQETMMVFDLEVTDDGAVRIEYGR